MNTSHHFRSLTVAALMGLCWTAGEGVGQGTDVITHDLSRDFSTASNPNGVWSYGWKSNLTGHFNLFLNTELGAFDNGVPAQWWDFAPHQIPAVGYNASSTTGTSDGGQGNYPPGTVWFYAGFDGWPQNFGAIRFTAPVSASYLLESAVRCYLDGDRSSDTDYHVVVNGVELFGEFIPPRSASGYTNTLNLAAGDTVDFITGRGADERQFGSGLKIQAALTTPVVCTPHKAKAVSELVNGFVVGAKVVDPGCGYTNPPAVLIRGGGGQGAMARAIITDGVVTGIQVTDAGCCYTNTPRILIGSPPFVPKVSIATSKVKVTLNVVLGWKYVLESSKDLMNWAPTGPAFVAESEEIVEEFDVELAGTYFRVRVVPN